MYFTYIRSNNKKDKLPQGILVKKKLQKYFSFKTFLVSDIEKKRNNVQ